MAAPAPGPDKSFIDLGIVTIDGKKFQAKLVYRDSNGRQVQDITHLDNPPILPETKKNAITTLVKDQLTALNEQLKANGALSLKDRASIEITGDKIEATALGPEKETFNHIGHASVTDIFRAAFKELNTLYETTPRATTAPAAQAQAQAPLGAGEALEIRATIAQPTRLQQAQRALAEKLRQNPGRDLNLDEVRENFDRVYEVVNPQAAREEGEAAAAPAIQFNLDTEVDFMAACLGLEATLEGGNHTFSRLENMGELQTAMQNQDNRRLLKDYIMSKIPEAQRGTMGAKFIRAKDVLTRGENF